MPASIFPVVLCGGSGTRLWPLSRQMFPKQFVPLIDGKSLLQLTLERVKSLSEIVMTVESDDHRFLVQDAAETAGVTVRHLLEPVGRNTAAAMAAAALAAPNAKTLLLFFPADHHIPDTALFMRTVQEGVTAAEAGFIVTFGVTPTFPSSAYGYIEVLDVLGSDPKPKTLTVQRFIEKPDAARAQQLILQGNHFWNAGIFLIQADTLIAALEQHAPDILNTVQEAMSKNTQDGAFTRLNREAFTRCRSESIDYAVLEKYSRVAMVPFHGAWSDVGSWNAVAELSPADADNNRILGQGRAWASKDTFIHAPHRPVIALGTDSLFIIDTPDAVLVAHANHTETVKQIVGTLTQEGLPQATHHRRVARPWGVFDSVDSGERFQVKRITVKPGARLSLQMHHHRAEHWVVVKGTAQVTRGDEVLVLEENQSVYVPLGVRHRLENIGAEPLEIIEVQSGSYLGEDDIVRFEDGYGRS